MNKSIYSLIRRALVPLFFLVITMVQGQPVGQFKIINDTLLDAKDFQFDVYFRNKPNQSSWPTIPLTSYTLAFKDSISTIINGGTVTASWVAGSSQMPTSPGVLTPYGVGASVVYLNNSVGRITQGGVSCSLSSVYDPIDTNWLRLYSIKLANTQNFAIGRANLNFYYNSSGGTFKIAYYNGFAYTITGVCDTTTYPGSDTLNSTTANPYFNKALTVFNVTGGGTPGLTTVGLSGSEVGCAYSLQLNGAAIPGLQEVVGTGSALSWTNLTAGTYTIIGRRIATYITNTAMNGSAVVIAASNPPGAAGTITGPTTVCQGQTNVQYQTTHIQYANNTVWNYSGTGYNMSSLNDTTITLTFNNTAGTGGYLTIYGQNALGNGTADSIQITVNPLAGAAGTITGNSTVNPGDVQTYVVPAINNATTYTWNYTGQGATYSSTTTTNTLVITFATSGATGGNLTVYGTNSCNNGTISQAFAITVAAAPPAAAGSIVGNSSPCAGTNNVVYSVPPIAGVNPDTSGYVWNYTGTGASWFKSSTGDTVYISFASNATSGILTVEGQNTNGYGTVSPNDTITINLFPSAAGTITGNSSECLNIATTYTVGTIANATSYVWTIPGGSSGSSTTNTINVTFTTAGIGSITVKGQNGCGFGTASTLADTSKSIPTFTSDPITGYDQSVCPGNATYSNVSYNLTQPMSGATSYVWTLPSGVSLVSGTDTTVTDTIRVDFVTFYNATVYLKVNGRNACGLSAPDSIGGGITENAYPVTPSTITGPNPICQGSSGIYRVNPVTNATNGYTWGLPGGTSGSSNADTIKVTYLTSAVSGNITVRGISNSCGAGPASTLAITVNPLPSVAAAITGPTSVCPGQVATYWIHKSTYATGNSWTLPTGFSGSSTDTTISVTISSSAVSGSDTIRVAPYDTCGYAASTFIAVTVNPINAITSITGANTCSGSQFTVTPVNGTNGTVLAGTTYSWSAPSGTGFTGGATGSGAASITGTLIDTTSSKQIATYTVTPTTALGCSSSAFTVTDTINPAPIILTMNNAACTGTGFTVTPLNGTNGKVPKGTTYTWATPAGTGFTGGAAGSDTIVIGTLSNANNVAKIATYTVTPTSGLGCVGATFSVIDTVNPKATINTITASSECSGSPFTVTPTSANGTVPAGTTYSWAAPTVTGSMTGGASGSGTASITGTLTNSTSFKQTATYTVTPLSGSCSGSNFSVIDTVNAIPVAPGVTNIGYCLNATASPLSATGQTGATFKWYYVPTGGTSYTSITPLTISVGVTPYYVSQTLYSCESPRAVDTVSVTSPPEPTAPNVAYCNNATAVPLTASGQNLKWYTFPTGGTGSTTAITPTTNQVGTKSYYVSQTISSCESPRDTIIVTTYAIPSAPDGSDNPPYYCQGVPAPQLVATGSTGSTLLWYTTATGGTGVTTAYTPSTVNAGDPNQSYLLTDYYVSQTVNGCESSLRYDISIYVFPAPDPPTVSNPAPYCQNATASQLSAIGQTLLWYTSATGGTGSTTAPYPSTITAGTFNYYVSQTPSGCESQRAVIQVTVIATPPLPTVANVAYCQYAIPSALNVTGQTGATFKWYSALTGGTGTSIAPTPSTSTLTPQHFYVSQTVNGCESPRATITVTVNAIPGQPTVVTPISYCQFATALPLTAGGSNLLWYSNATGGTGDTTFTPPTTVTGSFDYFVSQTVNGCESSTRADLTVIVNGTTPPSVSNNNISYCQFATATPLSATATGNGTLNWYTADGTASSTAPTPVDTTAGLFYFYVSQTANGCESPRDTITVIVNPTPAAPTSVNPGAYCQGATPSQLSATATGNGTLNWYYTATGGTGSATAPIPSTMEAGDSNYYVSQTVLGCESPRDSITVTVNAIPAEPLVSNPTPYCQYTIASVLTTENGTNLLWYTTSTGGTGDTTAPTPSTNTAGTFYYYVTQTINSCESQRATITVFVNPVPAITAMTDIACSGAAFKVTPVNITNGVVPTGTTYSWPAPIAVHMTGGASGSDTNVFGTLTNPTNIAQTGTYTVTPTTGSCVGSTFTVTVTINPTPNVTTASLLTICSGATTNIALSSNVTGSTFSWTVGTITGGITGASASSGATIAQSLTNSGASAGTVPYIVTPTANACTGIPTNIDVNVNPTPNVTTPITASICNGDITNITLTGDVTGTTFSWTIGTITGGITGASASNGTTIYQSLTNPGATSGSVIYIVTPSANACQGDSTNITVTVDPVPYIITMYDTVCSGTMFTVIPANITDGIVPTGTTYTWTAPVSSGITGGVSGSGTSISGTLTNTTNIVQTATYTVTPTSGNCTGTPFTVIITVNPKPVITAMTDTICSGTSFTKTPVNITNGIVPSGTTYTWTAPIVNGGITGGMAGSDTNINGTLINPTNTIQTATYTVIPTSGSCTGSPFTVKVTVNPVPAVTAMTATPCSGIMFTDTPANITNGLVPSGTTYSWAPPVDNGGFSGGLAGSSSTTISGTLTNLTDSTQTITYIVTPMANGCSGLPFTVIVTLNTIPQPAGLITGDTIVCIGNTGVYNVPAITYATSYTWSFAPAGSFTGSSITDSITLAAGTTIGLATIYVKGHNTCGDGSKDSLLVAIITTPSQPTLLPVDATVPVQGGTKKYYATPYYPAASGVSYTWTTTTTRVTLQNATSDTVTVTFLADSAINGYLKVNLSDLCGTSPNDSIHWGMTGINEYINDLSYHIYPNPTNGLLNIEINGITDNIELSIINSQGKIIQTESISRNNPIFKKELDLSSYARGIYFVRIVGKDFVKVEKVVVQ